MAKLSVSFGILLKRLKNDFLFMSVQMDFSYLSKSSLGAELSYPQNLRFSEPYTSWEVSHVQSLLSNKF